MNRVPALLACTLLLCSLFSCGGKTPPEPDAFTGKKVLSALRDLSHSYEKRDRAAFMDRVSERYEGRDALEQSTATTFARYESIRFAFQGTKMLVMVPDRGDIKASANWDGDWRTTGGDLVKDGGRVTLVFDPRDFRLVAIEGRNPFLPVTGPAKVQ